MNEFDVIARYFAPLCENELDDDAAVLSVPEGCELVVTTDTLNAGTHFLEGATPADIAHKALRVNLSDLVAMGAEPFRYQLAIAFPTPPDEAWLAEFTKALAEDQDTFGISCSGGDTTSIFGPLSISITAMGLVPAGKAVKRSGARAGDVIALSGPVGDALIGLKTLQDHNDRHCEEADADEAIQQSGLPRSFQSLAMTELGEHFISHYYHPQPRLDLISLMREYAHAAVDISDGLLADLGHIAEASGLAAVVELEKIAFSEPAQRLLDQGSVTAEELLSGGDDYELLLAMSEEDAARFPNVQIIGRFEEGSGVQLLDQQGKNVALKHTGWSHF